MTTNKMDRFIAIVLAMLAAVLLTISCVAPTYASTHKSSYSLAVQYARETYGQKLRIRVVDSNKLDKNPQILKNRKNKYVLIERTVSVSEGNNGRINGKWFIMYNKHVKRGRKVVSYSVYNPHNNYVDDVVAVADNNMIR